MRRTLKFESEKVTPATSGVMLWALDSLATAVFFSVVRSVFFLFHLGLWVFYRKSGVFLLWSKNVCCITVFSIQEYSSFTGAINVQSQLVA